MNPIKYIMWHFNFVNYYGGTNKYKPIWKTLLLSEWIRKEKICIIRFALEKAIKMLRLRKENAQTWQAFEKLKRVAKNHQIKFDFRTLNNLLAEIYLINS